MMYVPCTAGDDTNIKKNVHIDITYRIIYPSIRYIIKVLASSLNRILSG